MKKSLLAGGIAVLVLTAALVLWIGYRFRPSVPEPTTPAPPERVNPPASVTPPASTQKLRVALVLSGAPGDQAFVDLVLAGLERAGKDLGIEVRKSFTPKPTDWEPELKAAVAEGYGLIIAGDSHMKYALGNIARAYPDARFIMLGDTLNIPNVLSVGLDEGEGAFLAGALAAMVTSDRDDKSANAEKVVGWVGGPENAASRKILSAYKQGALYIDKQARVLGEFSGSFGEPAEGREAAVRQLAARAGVITTYARGTNPGVIAAVKGAGKKAILGEPARPDKDESILASVVLAVDDVVYDIIRTAASGKLETGKTVIYGLSTGHIRVIMNGVPPRMKARVDEISEKIKKREIPIQD